ncbi:MAG: GNAT family N-acetyltransferase [Spirochaetales bacterium]|nr:GNAT family N-acetyltransferase [Spirochaetales bacterium]
MDKVFIREMCAGDIEGVHRLMEQLDSIFDSHHDISFDTIKRTFAEMEEKNDIYVNYIAEVDNAIMGFISAVVYKTFFHKSGTLLINELVIDRESRGKGIGEKLLQTVIGIARDRGLNEVEVSTSFDNKRAIVFYRKHGLIDESIVCGMELNK